MANKKFSSVGIVLLQKQLAQARELIAERDRKICGLESDLEHAISNCVRTDKFSKMAANIS